MSCLHATRTFDNKNTLTGIVTNPQVKIQALDFSSDEQFLASLGGPDDNSVVRHAWLHGELICLTSSRRAITASAHLTFYLQVLWDVQTGSAICGSPTHTNFTMCLKFFHNSNDKIVTGGNYNLHVWEYDRAINKLRSHEAQLGQLQRIFKSICIDSRDQFAYCGTTTGDVLQVSQMIFILEHLVSVSPGCFCHFHTHCTLY